MRLIIEFLKYNLSSIFFQFPNTSLSKINKYLDLSIAQTLVDANIKYSTKSEVRNEEELINLCLIDPTIEAVLLYRLERNIFLNDPNSSLLPFLASLMKRRTGSEIYYSTSIGKGFNIQHGFGIIIGPRHEIGDFFTVHQGVTLGQKSLNSPNEKIQIGNNVTIFAGAIVLGNITIGNNSQIGANSVLLSDIEENSIYAGIPAKRIK